MYNIERLSMHGPKSQISIKFRSNFLFKGWSKSKDSFSNKDSVKLNPLYPLRINQSDKISTFYILGGISHDKLVQKCAPKNDQAGFSVGSAVRSIFDAYHVKLDLE